MKTSIKLVTAFAALATLSTSTVFAQSKSDEWKLNKPHWEKPQLSLSGGGTAVYATSSTDSAIDDIENFDELGGKIRIRDLNLSAEATMSIFSGKLTLEENTNDLSVDATTLKDKVRDLLVGVNLVENKLYVYAGKTDIPFGADQSDDAESDVTKLNEQLERRAIVAVKVTPAFAKQVFNTAVKLESIEVARSASASSRSDVRFNDKLDTSSARVIATIGKVLTQASYMRTDRAEYRASLSAARAFAPEIVGPFEIYTEFQILRHSPYTGDINVGTIGATKALPTQSGKWSVGADYSRIQAAGTSANARNAGSGSVKYQLNKMVSVQTGLRSHALAAPGVVSPVKDTNAFVEVKVQTQPRAELGSMGKDKKDADGQILRDQAAAMRAK
ncbi:MAG: hypothetical protein V4596_00105 [Bdellovibrionota bacterium]